MVSKRTASSCVRIFSSHPLPLQGHFGVGLLDENSDPSEHLAPPITQLLDSRIYQPASGRPRTLSGLRWRVSSFSFLPPKAFGVPLLHGCCCFPHGCCRLAVT